MVTIHVSLVMKLIYFTDHGYYFKIYDFFSQLSFINAHNSIFHLKDLAEKFFMLHYFKQPVHHQSHRVLVECPLSVSAKCSQSACRVSTECPPSLPSVCTWQTGTCQALSRHNQWTTLREHSVRLVV